MIKVARQELLDEGYIVLREMIPKDALEPLREGFEELVRRQWPDGIPDDHFQPRIFGFEQLVDESTAITLEFCLGENTLGVARQLMPNSEVALNAMFLMCNPVRDHGSWFWHRDYVPPTEGPLRGMQMDFLANGPAFLQWNVALYDDDVFWVVPGSHRRPNTEAEDRQLGAVPHSYANSQRPRPGIRHTPLPDGVCVDLKAGDGVVYTNMMLHWGSNYSPKMRRCIHIGHRSFGGPMFYHQGFRSNIDFTRVLSPESQELYQRSMTCYDQELDTLEAAFRAIISNDEEGFLENLKILHPGEQWRVVCLIHLCKRAQRIQSGNDAEFGPRFTDEEISTLWMRFRFLDEALQDEEPTMMPGFLLREPTRYRSYDLPENFGVEEFTSSWGQ